MTNQVPDNHPRAASLRQRYAIAAHAKTGLVAETGTISHGRGEAFDYLLGEETPEPVKEHIKQAAALLLQAKHPVISINGNAAVLAGQYFSELSKAIPAKLEVNVFYGRTQERESMIAEFLKQYGANDVLGINPEARVPNLHSARGSVDKEGIAKADVVLVPLEDGDRTEALIAWGKKVISIDLNPLSRTARKSTINICDNITRAIPLMTAYAKELKGYAPEINKLADSIDNDKATARVLRFMRERLQKLEDELEK
ncbi:MAG: phosphopantothenate/pantothenate synthetase [Alphaproteobacteria bacterium]|nr:phosphopantothenate/pantothenate synthetase [Alphaproteobacteria bacterium]MCL2505375.1 phosphopantothenate/pantothenate synthetase [Alphaproteobacteria bacterium]